MSKKVAIPDELMEMVSGGVLTHGGSEVTELVFGLDCMQVTREDGKFAIVYYSAEDQKLIDKDPGIIKQWMGIAQECADDTQYEYRLEDLVRS